ncbi:adenosylmethionine decarboxylase [Thermosulfurimonas dismutans]|uniref:S-adenosylmethionine decarboxylase proenzyme, prokaryotic class 1B n=1 Tax=Thermosulfurimonas dismutans TaxID=999894 RepID=A0A179D759_9BACT|nr:adenosylmethionine decarboxylase [Thermosulfurimonas dismutans]OAQ21877.1 S-adenosylmethionine decarboxylase proenzyme, prokaryotic class 1B [Thermosulfurimonas dismutans]
MREMTPVCQIDRLDVFPAQGGRQESIPVTTHLLVEMWEAPFNVLARVKEVEKALRYSGNGHGESGEVISYQFEPYGVSAKATFEEVHIFIHTWPENGYAAVDIFASSKEGAYEILERMKEAFRPRYMHVVEVKRGNLVSEGET